MNPATSPVLEHNPTMYPGCFIRCRTTLNHCIAMYPHHPRLDVITWTTFRCSTVVTSATCALRLHVPYPRFSDESKCHSQATRVPDFKLPFASIRPPESAQNHHCQGNNFPKKTDSVTPSETTFKNGDRCLPEIWKHVGTDLCAILKTAFPNR